MTTAVNSQVVAGALMQRRTMVVLTIMQVIGTVGVGVAPSIGVLLAGEVTQNEAWAGLLGAQSRDFCLTAAMGVRATVVGG